MLFATCALLANETSDEAKNKGDKKSSKVDKQDIKKAMKENVSKNEFGDVTIKFMTKGVSEKAAKAPNVESVLFTLLCYVDSDLDFEKLNDCVSQSLGLKKGESLSSSYPVKDLMKGVDRYLASKNMNLRSLNFSANNVRNKLDEGLPLYGRIKKTEAVSEIASRQSKRGEESKPDEWAKKLRKLEIKKVNDKVKFVTPVLVAGYNKETNEYLIFTGGKPLWISEAEFKTLFVYLYQLRI